MLLVFYILYFIGWTLALPVLCLLSLFVIKKWKSSLLQKLTIFDKDFFYAYSRNKNQFKNFSDTRLSSSKKRSLPGVNEHFEGESNAVDENFEID